MRGNKSKLAILLLVLGLIAAACGGGGEAGGGGDTESAAAGEETSAEDTAAASDTASAEDTASPEDTASEEMSSPEESASPEDTGSAEETTPAEGAEGGVVSIQVGEPAFLYPPQTQESEGGEVLESLFTGLVTYDAETAEPVFEGVAESIESEDQTTFTVTLRDDFTFHDGTPVTAQSFVDAWNYTAYGPNAAYNAYFMERIAGFADMQCPEEAIDEETGACAEGTEVTTTELAGLEVVSDTEFTVTLDAPFSQFTTTVGYTAFYPLPEVFYEDEDAFNEEPVGNGPFMMDGPWEHDVQIATVRYPDYPDELEGNASGVTFTIIDDLDTAYNEVLGGNLDFLQTVPPAQIESARTEFGERFVEQPIGSYNYVGFPLYDERFTDPRIRQALSLAVDRQAISTTIFSDTRVPAASVVAPTVLGARPDPCEFCTFDVEQAQALWEEAGGPEVVGDTITLMFNSGGGHEEWTEAVANYWQQAFGITTEFTILEFAEYTPLLQANGATGPFRLGWLMDYPSMENFLKPIFFTDGSSNDTGYSNPEVDALIDQGDQAESAEAGVEFYQQAEDIILSEMPVMPIFFTNQTSVHSERLSNVVVDPYGRLRVDQVNVEA